MKRIFLTAGIATMVATATFAHGNIDRRENKEARTERREARKELRRERSAENSKEVSYRTRNQFAIDFPGASNVHFVKTKNFEEVHFMSGKDRLRAYYDYDSQLVGTTQKKSFADLPENAQKKIQKEYAAYTIAEVIKFDDNESNDTDMILYGTSFDDADNYFVELKNDSKSIIVKVDVLGGVSFFEEMK